LLASVADYRLENAFISTENELKLEDEFTFTFSLPFPSLHQCCARTVTSGKHPVEHSSKENGGKLRSLFGPIVALYWKREDIQITSWDLFRFLKIDRLKIT
jgi:hypothetical protein